MFCGRVQAVPEQEAGGAGGGEERGNEFERGIHAMRNSQFLGPFAVNWQDQGVEVTVESREPPSDDFGDCMAQTLICESRDVRETGAAAGPRQGTFPSALLCGWPICEWIAQLTIPQLPSGTADIILPYPSRLSFIPETIYHMPNSPDMGLPTDPPTYPTT